MKKLVLVILALCTIPASAQKFDTKKIVGFEVTDSTSVIITQLKKKGVKFKEPREVEAGTAFTSTKTVKFLGFKTNHMVVIDTAGTFKGLVIKVPMNSFANVIKSIGKNKSVALFDENTEDEIYMSYKYENCSVTAMASYGDEDGTVIITPKKE